MGQEKKDIPFRPEYKEPEDTIHRAMVLSYKGSYVLLQKERERVKAPLFCQCKELEEGLKERFFMGYYKEIPCYCGEWQEDVALPEGFEWVYLNEACWVEDRDLFFTCVRGRSFLNWHYGTLFCGHCGGSNHFKENERAKICPRCGTVNYPRISPAIIVGIKKGDKLLLAHNEHFRQGLYSIIAGYVEQGESVEQAVRREVEEEVGIQIKNIQYYGSTPWYNGDSLILGFTAEYESGEIQVDQEEIVDAGWYSKECLPLLPSPISIARSIINELLGL